MQLFATNDASRCLTEKLLDALFLVVLDIVGRASTPNLNRFDFMRSHNSLVKKKKTGDH